MNEKLNFQNMKELAPILLKRENGDKTILSVGRDSGDICNPTTFERVLEYQKELKINSLKEALNSFIKENTDEDFIISGLVNEVTKNYVENEKEIFEIALYLEEYVKENFTIDYEVEKVLENSKVKEITLYLRSDETESKNNLLNEHLSIKNFNNLEGIKKLEENSFNPVAFLVQSQGYEVEDLFDKNRRENSNFLKSLYSEMITNNELHNGIGIIAFTKVDTNLKELVEILDNKEKNIVIPKDLQHIGIVNIGKNVGSDFEVVLEKDIVISRKNIEIGSEYGDYGAKVQEIYNFVSGKDEVKFKTTDEKGFEQHSLNLDKIIEKYKENGIDEIINQVKNKTKEDVEKETELFLKETNATYKDRIEKVAISVDDLFYGHQEISNSKRGNNTVMDKTFDNLVNDAINYAISEKEIVLSEVDKNDKTIFRNKVSNVAINALTDVLANSEFEIKNNYLDRKSSEFGIELTDFDIENPEEYKKNIDNFINAKINDYSLTILEKVTEELSKDKIEIPNLENNIFKEYKELKQQTYDIWRDKQESLLFAGKDIELEYKNKDVQEELKNIIKSVLKKENVNMSDLEKMEQVYNEKNHYVDTNLHKKEILEVYNKVVSQISEKEPEPEKAREINI